MSQVVEHVTKVSEFMLQVADNLSQNTQLQDADLKQLMGKVDNLWSASGNAMTKSGEEAFSKNGLATKFADYVVAQSLADRSNKNKLTEADHLAIKMVACLVNFSDESLSVCRELSHHSRFFTQFFRPLLATFDHNKMFADLVQSSMDIVYNMYFKNDPEIFEQLQQYDLVPSVQPLLKHRSVELSTSALLLIAFAVDERQAEIFQGAKVNISHLIGILRKSLSRAGKSAGGYQAIEVAKCINRLALNDGNKELLVQLDLLPVLMTMLDSKVEEEVSHGLEILFTLSFSQTNLVKIRADFKKKLVELGANSKLASNRALKSLLFRLDDSPNSRPASANQKKQQHGIMISYNHASSQLVRKLHQAMLQRGLHPWIDFEQMRHGSTLDAMAAAVDSASVIVLCITRLYKESNNCRLEAEYAWRCGKHLIPVLMESKYKPTGWLGLLLGSQLYFDLTGIKYSFEDKFKEMMLAVDIHLGQQHQQLPQQHQQPPQQHQQPPQQQQQQQQQQLAAVREHSFPVLPGITQLRSWDADRVSAWCKEQKLCSKLCAMQMTGSELQFLANTLRRSPEYFGRVMDKFVQLDSLRDLSKFVLALEDLSAGR